ncbi:hypothetical protein GGR53DRAFT_477136 [Hypoxylon sp. FL1150]|nr:hypothetical protein GGR53DRAFT_477136 [Hypoxylon sp. FL1150]
MSPPRTSTEAAASRPTKQPRSPRPVPKRTLSFAGFFSKILPSNRSESGGARRANERTGDNNTDVVADPDEITDWNIAKEKDPAYPTFGADPEVHNRRRVWSWSPQKGDSRFVENLPRDRSRGRGKAVDIPVAKPQQPRKSDTLRRAEVHEALKIKEESRKNRRSLKESGDWLGVQGADPYSGEYPVLTPTDTPSSDTTGTSTRSRLAGLARKKKTAKLEYEQIRLLEEQEKDKARLDKEQAKLSKIERVKEELRRQQQFTRWSQHKRHWSSAAEPNLSPIAQSLDSVALGSSETSSLLFSEMPTDSLISDGDEILSAVPNFSRPTRPPVSMNRHSSDYQQSRGRRSFDLSTETIIHNKPDANFEHTTLSRPTSQPSGAPLNAVQSDMGRTKSERHFLWRRRRKTDPGKSTPVESGGLVVSMKTQNQTSSSIVQVQKDHFDDLAIPDYHLHLLTPDTVETTDSQSTISDNFPSTTPRPISLGVMGRNRMENDRVDKNASSATVISSQSNLKGTMRHSSIPRKLVPTILVNTPSKDKKSYQRLPSFDEIQDRTVNGFIRKTLDCQSQQQPLSPVKTTNFGQTVSLISPVDSHAKRTRRESVSIPITTITGCAPDQQSQLDFPEPKIEAGPSQVDSVTETIQAPAQLTLPNGNGHEHYTKPVMISEKARTPSPPIMPRSDSPNLELAQEIPETVTTLTHPATSEKPPTSISTPITPRLGRLIQQNAEANRIDTFKITDLPNGKDTHEIVKNTKTETPKPTETKRSRSQEAQVPKIGPGRHCASPGRARATSIPESQPRVEPRDTAMVEEAARIAVLRSKAREIVRSKSADRQSSRTKSRSPSPVKKQAPNSSSSSSRPPEPKHSLQQRWSKKRRPSEGGAGIGLPSKPSEHVGNSATTSSVQHKNAYEKARGPNEAVTVMQLCKTIYFVLLGLACNWWIAVRPVFDHQSDLWRRRCKNMSTWRDVGTFASAGAFCLAAMLGGWYVLGMFWWVARLGVVGQLA